MWNSTDWNKHNAIGGTLLENWVEERATHDFIDAERKQGVAIDRRGHQHILSVEDTREMSTTCRDSFKIAPVHKVFAKKEGALREILERAWMETVQYYSSTTLIDSRSEIAAQEKKESEYKNAPVVSTSTDAFSHTDLYPNLTYLGEHKPSSEKSDEFRNAITFWSEHAASKDGATICSVDAGEYTKMRGGNDVRFGKHAAFSTPIAEYTKDVCK